MALTALVLAVGASPPAAAQRDGVFIDPDSPAGQEYAVPLDQARRDAAGGGGGGGAAESGGSGGQPLFGVGIGRGDEARGKANGVASGQGGVAGAKRAGGDDSARARNLAPNPGTAAAIEGAASEGSEALLTGGVAAAVLAAGLLIGFGLRRLLRGE